MNSDMVKWEELSSEKVADSAAVAASLNSPSLLEALVIYGSNSPTAADAAAVQKIISQSFFLNNCCCSKPIQVNKNDELWWGEKSDEKQEVGDRQSPEETSVQKAKEIKQVSLFTNWYLLFENIRILWKKRLVEVFNIKPWIDGVAYRPRFFQNLNPRNEIMQTKVIIFK